MEPDKELDELWNNAVQHNRSVARAVQADLRNQTRRLSGKSISSGVRLYETRTGAIVSLGKIQSALATPGGTIAVGKPFLWIRTDDGKRLGFKRMSPGYWDGLKRKYGNDIFIRKNGNGVVLYRSRGKLVTVYLLRKSSRTPQKLNLWDTAQSKFSQEDL
jgi:hypothetical protein